MFYSYGPLEAPRPGPRERPEAVSTSSTVVLYGTQLQTLYVRAHNQPQLHTTHILCISLSLCYTNLPTKLKPLSAGLSKIKTWICIILAVCGDCMVEIEFSSDRQPSVWFVKMDSSLVCWVEGCMYMFISVCVGQGYSILC